MKLSTLVGSAAVWAIAASLSFPVVAQAQNLAPADVQKLRTPAPAAVGTQTASPTALCFTCGGDWPNFMGSFNVVSATNNVTERGSSCASPLSARTDSRPFLCGR
jgi:hypothetical protein